MKNKIIRLLVAIGIVCVFLLVATVFNTLVTIISEVVGFNLEYILIPILIVWAIWLVYGLVNKIANNKEDNQTEELQ